MNLNEHIAKKLRELPKEPGCYVMRNQQGKIIYVGKAVSLRKRVQSYFRSSTFYRADPKLRSLLRSVWDIEWFVTRSEAEALLMEGKLIKEYKPRYNVAFRDDKRFLMLRTNPSDPFPYFKVCRFARNDGAVYFGPYVSSRAARLTLDFIEKKYGLRKCEPRIPDKNTYKHCINDIIRYCSAPCIGKISKKDYHKRIEESCAFLNGERIRELEDLKKQIKEASDRMDFEKAAELRDTLFAIKDVIKQKTRVLYGYKRKEEILKGLAEIKHVLKLENIPKVIECFDVSNISGSHATASMVCAIDGLPVPARYRRFRIKTVDGMDDFKMMAEVIERRYNRLLTERGQMPDLIVIDGGIGQLHAAARIMKKLNLHNISIIGLAKKMEEIYTVHSPLPLKLEHNSQALNIIRRLRDEAHRFALAYHQKLRNKRIQESVLDEIPGIGRSKKMKLLSHFGSVFDIANASKEEIAEVEGIGNKLAMVIKETLSALQNKNK